MPNVGIAPPDLTSEVGQFRIVVGDLEYKPLEPPQQGRGDYEKWSDGEVEGFLAMGSGSTLRAAGFAYLQLASGAALASQSVADYDLKVDTTKRAADLRAIAQAYFEQADDLDDADGNGDIFDMFDLTGNCDIIPEGTIPQYGRYYTTGRVH